MERVYGVDNPLYVWLCHGGIQGDREDFATGMFGFGQTLRPAQPIQVRRLQVYGAWIVDQRSHIV